MTSRSTPATTTSRGIGLWLLVAAVVGTIAFVAGLVLTRPTAVPPSLRASPAASETIEPVANELLDERQVDLTVTRGAAHSVIAPADGLLTSLECRPDAPWTSWTSTVTIDGRPLLNLATDVPLWRDLVVGDRGRDVEAVQAALASLGHGIVVDGLMGPRAIGLINARIVALGGAVAETAVLSRSDVLRLPAATVVPDTCDAVVGTFVNDGGALLTSTASVEAVSVRILPSDLVRGDRRIVTEAGDYAVDATGSVVGADLARFAADLARDGSEETEAEPAEDITAGGSPGSSSGGTTDAVLRLASPLSAWIVPPAALTAVRGSDACVVAGGRPIAVTVIASALGRSYVVAADGAFPAPVETAPDAGTTC